MPGQINDSPRQNPAYRFAVFYINPGHKAGIVRFKVSGRQRRQTPELRNNNLGALYIAGFSKPHQQNLFNEPEEINLVELCFDFFLQTIGQQGF